MLVQAPSPGRCEQLAGLVFFDDLEDDEQEVHYK